MPLALLALAASFGAGPTTAWAAEANSEWHYHVDDIRITVRDIPKGRKAAPAHDLFVATERGKRPLNHIRFANAPQAARLLMAERQPTEDLFLLRKEGGGTDRLLIITSKGVIRDLPPGDVFAIPKLHLMIVLATDAKQPPTSLVVLDLSTGKVELEVKDASRPREYLVSGKNYRVWLTDSEVLAEPENAAPGASWLRISIDGKQLEHVPPPEAEARKFFQAVLPELPGSTSGIHRRTRHHWVRLGVRLQASKS